MRPRQPPPAPSHRPISLAKKRPVSVSPPHILVLHQPVAARARGRFLRSRGRCGRQDHVSVATDRELQIAGSNDARLLGNPIAASDAPPRIRAPRAELGARRRLLDAWGHYATVGGGSSSASAGAGNWDNESRFPSGSLNHRTRLPSGNAHTPWSFCGSPSNHSGSTPR